MPFLLDHSFWPNCEGGFWYPQWTRSWKLLFQICEEHLTQYDLTTLDHSAEEYWWTLYTIYIHASVSMHLLYIDLFLAAAKNPVNLVQMRCFPNVLRGPSRLGRQQQNTTFWVRIGAGGGWAEWMLSSNPRIRRFRWIETSQAPASEALKKAAIFDTIYLSNFSFKPKISQAFLLWVQLRILKMRPAIPFGTVNRHRVLSPLFLSNRFQHIQENSQTYRPIQTLKPKSFSISDAWKCIVCSM